MEQAQEVRIQKKMAHAVGDLFTKADDVEIVKEAHPLRTQKRKAQLFTSQVE